MSRNFFTKRLTVPSFTEFVIERTVTFSIYNVLFNIL